MLDKARLQAAVRDFSDHVSYGGSGLLEQMLYRLAVVAIAFIVAGVLEHRVSPGDLGLLAPALGFAAISVLASWWLPFLVIDLGLALLLFRGITHPDFARSRWGVAVLQANRLVGHAEALLSWIALCLAWVPAFRFQILAAAIIVGFGPMVLDGLGWAFGGREGMVYRGDRYFARRPFVLVSTVAGMALLWVTGWPLVGPLLPLTLLVLFGVTTRGIWLYFVRQPERRGRFLVPPWAADVDRLATLLLIAAAAALPLRMASGLGDGVAHDGQARARTWTRCDAESAAPAIAGLFVVSDNQFHDLTAPGDGLQTQVLDSFVHVARRPVELDSLSSATLAEFARQYRVLQTTRPQLEWAHLGDMGDLGCKSEMDRLGPIIERFGRGSFAGFAPGNHDSSYVGNLSWHPDWTKACAGALAEHDAIEVLTRPDASPGAVSPVVARTGPGSPFHVTISDLSFAHDRSVVGIFLDTTDYGMLELGLTGVQGSVSRAQRLWVEERLAEIRQRNDPYLLLLMHHPRDALTPWGRRHVRRLIDENRPRLLAVVAAHTHLAADRTAAPSDVPELIVGSTTDPPQEATLILVRGEVPGPLHLSFRTTAAVARPGATCPDALGIDADVCAARLEMMAADPRLARCAPLVHDQTIAQAAADAIGRCLWDKPSSPASIRELRAALDSLPSDATDTIETAACLSWVASVVQGKKDEHWSTDSASALAYDRAATPGELRAVFPPKGGSAPSVVRTSRTD